MIAGSLENGKIDTEFTPELARVAPPLGDVVHRLERTAAVQAEEAHKMREELHAQHTAILALTARVYALEAAAK